MYGTPPCIDLPETMPIPPEMRSNFLATRVEEIDARPVEQVGNIRHPWDIFEEALGQPPQECVPPVEDDDQESGSRTDSTSTAPSTSGCESDECFFYFITT